MEQGIPHGPSDTQARRTRQDFITILTCLNDDQLAAARSILQSLKQPSPPASATP